MKVQSLLLSVMRSILVFSLLTACAPADSTVAPTLVPTIQATVVPTESTANFPTGKFVLPDNRFEGLYFDQNGTWYAFFAGERVQEGTYSTTGSLYIEESNNSNCGESPMSFKYTFDGTNLKFDLTDQSRNDTCENRRLSFDGITYVLTE
jgi:hypothetical protein